MSDQKIKKKKRKWPFILLTIVIIFLLFVFWDDEEDYDSLSSDDEYYSYDDCEDGECSNVDSDYNEDDYYDYWDYPVFEDYPLGTCGELNGTTVVVSIYAGDGNIGWDDAEPGLVEDSLNYLIMGTDWISENAKPYGCEANFICDWSLYEDLYYEATIQCDFMDVNSDTIDDATCEYVQNNIDVEGLKDKYAADNILFVYMLNPPKDNQDTSATRVYYQGFNFPYESCYMYMYTDYVKETPSAFSHEILHAFGAPDLYMADTTGDNYGITQEFVDMCEDTYCNDIMFTTYGNETYKSYYNKITNDFTELDAYYVGITDSSEVAKEWGFDVSEHFR